MLIERKDDHVAGGKCRENRVERAALRQHAEPGLVEAARDERVEPFRLDRAAHEMKAPAHFRIVADAGDRRDLPIAEVAGQYEHALALSHRRNKRLDVLDANQRGLARLRQPAELEELTHQAPQVAVMSLRQTDNLVLRNGVAVNPREVFEDHAAPNRKAAVEDATRYRNDSDRRLRERDRRCTRAIVRQR